MCCLLAFCSVTPGLAIITAVCEYSRLILITVVSFFLNIFIYILPFKKEINYCTVEDYKDYKVNYICTYISQLKKEKNCKATFNNPLTA